MYDLGEHRDETSLITTTIPAGSAAFTLTVTGTDFVPDSVVLWKGTNLPTTYVDANHLSVNLSALMLSNPGTYTVTVFNPAPAGGTSNGLSFIVQVNADHPFQTFLAIVTR